MTSKKSTITSTPITSTPAPAVVAAVIAAPKVKATKKVAEALVIPSVPVAAVSAPIVAAEKAPKTPKAPKVPKVEAVATPVIVAIPIESVEADAEAEGGDEKKGRKVISKQSVYEDFLSLISKINEEITKRDASPAAESDPTAEVVVNKKKRKIDAGVPIKFLRTVNKRLAVLQSNASKMMKLKTKTIRDNTKSGLMKPVGISEALYKFLHGAKFEVSSNTKYARVDITRMIHSYVKDNNLRKEEDKRVILPDTKLCTLLNYDPKTAKDEMTYFRLPQHLKAHFIKDIEVVAA